MISAWWVLAVIPIFFVAHILGYNKCLRRQRRLNNIVCKLIMANNPERALKLLDVAEGVQNMRQQRTFDERLREMDK
jgi:hypothetical protein